MRPNDIRRDLSRAEDDVNEVAEVLRAEAEGFGPGDVHSDYASKIQRITGECYRLRNLVRDLLG
jgi:hypothetical protein